MAIFLYRLITSGFYRVLCKSAMGGREVFGGIYEWVEGVEINNRVWKITDPDGSTRNVNAGTSNGWITNIAAENGPFFDVVPTNVGGNDSMHYSDYYSQTSSNSIVLARSYSGSDTSSGVCVSQRVEREFGLRFASCFPWNHIRGGSRAVQKITCIIISYFNCF